MQYKTRTAWQTELLSVYRNLIKWTIRSWGEERGEICYQLGHNDSFSHLAAVTWRGSCSSSEVQLCLCCVPRWASALLCSSLLSFAPALLPSFTYFSSPQPPPFFFFNLCAPVPVNLNVSVQVEIIHANQSTGSQCSIHKENSASGGHSFTAAPPIIFFPYCRTAACIQWPKGLNLLQLLPGFTYNFL